MVNRTPWEFQPCDGVQLKIWSNHIDIDLEELPGLPLHKKETSKYIYKLMNLTSFLTYPDI